MDQEPTIKGYPAEKETAAEKIDKMYEPYRHLLTDMILVSFRDAFSKGKRPDQVIDRREAKRFLTGPDLKIWIEFCQYRLSDDFIKKIYRTKQCRALLKSNRVHRTDYTPESSGTEYRTALNVDGQSRSNAATFSAGDDTRHAA